ncbi:hypothetical protein D9M72_584110 [compost metagenome]
MFLALPVTSPVTGNPQLVKVAGPSTVIGGPEGAAEAGAAAAKIEARTAVGTNHFFIVVLPAS